MLHVNADQTRLHRLGRTQTELDLLDLLTRIDIDGDSDLPVTHPQRIESFTAALRDGMTSVVGKESILHGWRVQNLFAEVIAALGSVRLLKSEDIGDCYYSGLKPKPADFRIRTSEGRLLLTDVKNVFTRHGSPRLALSQGELQGLERYASLAGADEVTVAAYWANLNLWTLVTLDTFAPEGDRKILTLPAAMMGNRMGELGDLHIGTRSPLTLMLGADDPQPINEAGEAAFSVGSVELLCDGDLIDDEEEQRIATQLMLHGSWPAEEEAVVEDGRLAAIRFNCRPEVREQDRQGFDLVGSLSSMYSAAFNHRTLGTHGEVRELASPVQPGSLGTLIPDGYSGEALPLWRFKQEPSTGDRPSSQQ